MAAPSPQQVTQLLQAWSKGDARALERLMPLVYQELHLPAKHYMTREQSAETGLWDYQGFSCRGKVRAAFAAAASPGEVVPADTKLRVVFIYQI